MPVNRKNNLGMTFRRAYRLFGAVTIFCLTTPIAAQLVERPPRTVAESLAVQGRALGTSYGEYQQLRQDRRQVIARLDRQLAACGRCADGPRLEAELARARQAESTVALAEADALQGMGLTQYGSIDELLMAMAKSLSQKYDFGTEYTRERIGRVVSEHCRAGRTAFDVKALVDCISDKNPQRQLALFSTALSYCQRSGGVSYVAQCRSNAGCDAFESCMRENSEAVALCTENMTKGYTPKLPRCFTTLLHEGLFAGGGIGSDDRKVQLEQQNAQAQEKAAARRAKNCEFRAKRLDDKRRAAYVKPNPWKEQQLARAESDHARDCGG